MKKRHLRPSIKMFIQCIAIAAVVFTFMYAMFGAVIQKSYEMTPPTAAEIADNPSLVRYAK